MTVRGTLFPPGKNQIVLFLTVRSCDELKLHHAQRLHQNTFHAQIISVAVYFLCRKRTQGGRRGKSIYILTDIYFTPSPSW